MLTEDYHPWLIEINCSPAMSFSTKTTTKLCSNVMEDTLKGYSQSTRITTYIYIYIYIYIYTYIYLNFCQYSLISISIAPNTTC